MFVGQVDENMMLQCVEVLILCGADLQLLVRRGTPDRP